MPIFLSLFILSEFFHLLYAVIILYLLALFSTNQQKRTKERKERRRKEREEENKRRELANLKRWLEHDEDLNLLSEELHQILKLFVWSLIDVKIFMTCPPLSFWGLPC